MKRGITAFEAESLQEENDLISPHEEERRAKHPREEFINEHIYLALIALKAGDNKAWEQIEQPSLYQNIAGDMKILRLAFEAYLAGHKQAWSFICRQYSSPFTAECFSALETCSVLYQSLRWERQFTLRYNQLAQAHISQPVLMPIKDNNETQELLGIIDEGLNALFNSLKI